MTAGRSTRRNAWSWRSTLDEPLCIVRGMDANGAKVTTFLKHENIIGYPDHYVQHRRAAPLWTTSAQMLTERRLDAKRIGVEMDANYLHGRLLRVARSAACPTAAFSDANLLVNWVRVVKSPREIELMRQAAQHHGTG